MNPYLVAQTEKYNALRASIEGLQVRASEEKRDLTEDELRSITEQAATAKSLAATLTDLTEIETRNVVVAALAAKTDVDVETAAVQNRSNPELTAGGRGGAQTRDRDPGHYTRSSSNSFFSDLNRAREGDGEAQRRLAEHNRALTTGAAGAGIVPPHWLVEEFDLLARQGRGLANTVRNIGLGSDPRPITLPKQLTGTDSVVAQQSSENTHPSETDAWTSGVDTVVPKPTSGIQIVSRQMLDMGSPAIDQLIYGDMIAAYNLKVEQQVGAALLAAATAVTGSPYATEAAFATAVPGDVVIQAAIEVRDARKLPADIVAMGVARYGKFLKLKDSTGRPLMPQETAGPMNVIGTGSVQVDGRLAGLGVIATDGVNVGGAYPDTLVVLRAADTILFESEVQRFRYEEVAGPESVKLGIWAYTAVIVRQPTKSCRKATVTAA